MTTYTKTIGSGGDYANFDAWQTARVAAAESVSGDTEEAVFLDGTFTHGYLPMNSGWPSGVKVRITAQNPHKGYWNLDEGGTKIVTTAQGAFQFGGMTNSGVVFEIDNLVLIGSSGSTFDRCIPINGENNNIRFLNCLIRNNNSAGAPIFIFGSNTTPKNIYLENCVIHRVGTAEAVYHAFTASSYLYLSAVGCFINGLFMGTASNQQSYLNFSGSILSGSLVGGTTSRSAVDCIGTNAWTGWTTTHCSAATFVEGTPTAGQVGFTSFSNYDFSLVDDDNNLAKNFVLTAQMPATDIKGTSRPQGDYSDAGAFEISLASPPQTFTTFLPISVVLVT